MLRSQLAQSKKRKFLEHLAETANVSASAEAARVPRRTIYYARAIDPEFAYEWDQALELGLDALEDEIVRRAKKGVQRPVFYQGEVCGHVREFSDTLAMFILKSRRREVYGEHLRTQNDNRNLEMLTPEQQEQEARMLLQRMRALRISVIEGIGVVTDVEDADTPGQRTEEL
jgi:hypothetical protein